MYFCKQAFKELRNTKVLHAETKTKSLTINITY